ncbi:hypothetical protein PAHAL_8G037200 [Panicum hallii]|uniref:Uncharacterized protein n=1 Tax=Panicum hallii TaxID=206008 RepID=A0A2S3ICK8_9POAL|nr:hypothetical protein PAHAL_8G037200 [Panicum hallii]
MAIPVARVHLAMAHAALPGLLPTSPRYTLLPLLPAPPCAIILPNGSPARPSRADAAERWDAYKIKQSGGVVAAACSLDSRSSSPGGASSSEKWVSKNKKSAASSSSSSSSSNGHADSEERWDAHKKPAASPASSSSTSASRSKRRDSSKRSNHSRASSSSAERWDAHKNPRALQANELDDGESSTGSNDMEFDNAAQPPPPLQRAFYAGPGFVKSPEPSMLPMPSFSIRVA